MRTSGRLDRRERRGQLDVVGEKESAAGQRRVPVEPPLRAVDDRLELEPDPLVPPWVDAGPDEVSAQLDGPGHSLDRELALDGERIAARRNRARRERELREPLAVEELGRPQVRVAVLVEGRDGRHLDRSLDGGCHTTDDRAADHRGAAGDGGEAQVLDVELHRRVRRVDRPRAFGDDDHWRLCEDGHGTLSFVSATIAYASKSTGKNMMSQVLSEQSTEVQ